MDARDMILYFSELQEKDKELKEKIKWVEENMNEDAKWQIMLDSFKKRLKFIRAEKRRINKLLFLNP